MNKLNVTTAILSLVIIGSVSACSGPTVRALCAKQDIAQGSKIDSSMLGMSDVEQSRVPANAAKDDTKLVNMVATRDIRTGDPVTDSDGIPGPVALYARKQIAANQEVTADMVELRTAGMPAPERRTYLTDTKNAVGRMPYSEIKAGQPLFDEILQGKIMMR